MNGVVTAVTGAAGFVGANLVRRLLDDGARVHALVRPPTDGWRLESVRSRLRVHDVDLTDRTATTQALRGIDPHVVFHLAKHRGDPATLDYRSAFATNLDATLTLLDAAAACRRLRRFVQAGSSLEYDLRRSPLREADAPAPVTVHGVTKAAGSLLAQHYAIRHGLPVVVLRLFTVYGPWEGVARFVPSLMTAALDRRPIGVTDVAVRHDWIFVADVVEACVRAATAPDVTGEILNVATGRDATNDEVVRLVEELVGAPVERREDPFPARAWDTDRWVADVEKTRRRLGWQASTGLREGLGRTLDWFRDHLDLYRGRP